MEHESYHPGRNHEEFEARFHYLISDHGEEMEAAVEESCPLRLRAGFWIARPRF